LDACLAKPEGSSTVGMVECTGDAIRACDKRLNEVYQQVMAGLDPKSQELLRASQRRWVAFREAEHGAMGGPILFLTAPRLGRDRARTIRSGPATRENPDARLQTLSPTRAVVREP
jgi:hypothetical protein